MGIREIRERDERIRWLWKKARELYDQGIRSDDADKPEIKALIDYLELTQIQCEDLFGNIKELENRYGV